MNNMKTKKIFLWALACLPLLMTIAVYPMLPDRIPLHWNMAGEIDRMGDKFPGALLLPAVCLLIPGLMSVLPKLDPRSENYSKFTGAYYWIRVCLVGIFNVITALVLMVSLGVNVPVDFVVKLLVGLLIMVIGNLMPKIKNNYFVGIRTPWTLNSENVWFATHRHGGMVWFGAGAIMSVLAFIPGSISGYIYFGVIFLAALEPMVYSYILHNRQKEK